MLDSIGSIRFDEQEKIALEYALEEIDDGVFLFGSRIDSTQKGSGIDTLVYSKANSLKLSRKIGLKFFEKCEEKIDAAVMDSDNLIEERQAFLNTMTLLKIENR